MFSAVAVKAVDNSAFDEALLKQKISQMLLVGFRGTQASSTSYAVKLVKDQQVGGVILMDYDQPLKRYGRNILNPKQLKKLISDLKSQASSPLFIAIDAEGGKVNRLKSANGFVEIPSAQQLGLKTASNTKKMALKLAKQLADLGINFNFAPVVDVNVNSANPVIGKLGRAFSADAFQVGSHAAAFIQGMHQYKIITSLKHFPGHGSSNTDSHLGLVDITNTYQALELIPYIMLLKQGLVDTVMTAHVINQNIDPVFPSTLSSWFINQMLRGLLGFKGVVVSDDLQMGAIVNQYGLGEAAVRAVNAGCDLLIISNNVSVYDEQAPQVVRDAILAAVKSGTIKESRVNEASNRIQQLKRQYNIIK